jgi:hypothetical protein
VVVGHYGCDRLIGPGLRGKLRDLIFELTHTDLPLSVGRQKVNRKNDQTAACQLQLVAVHRWHFGTREGTPATRAA